MNFELQSTFNKALLKTNASIRWVHRRRTTLALSVLVTNLIVVNSLIWLYLNNKIIPATYGSRPDGVIWIFAIKAGAFLIALLTCLSVYLMRRHALHMLFSVWECAVAITKRVSQPLSPIIVTPFLIFSLTLHFAKGGLHDLRAPASGTIRNRHTPAFISLTLHA